MEVKKKERARGRRRRRGDRREREREMGGEMEKALMSQDRGSWFKPGKLLRTTNIN